MRNNEGYDDDVRILHRMIIYLRDEAERLSIADVAMLMEKAEDVMEACVSCAIEDDTAEPFRLRGLPPTEH